MVKVTSYTVRKVTADRISIALQLKQALDVIINTSTGNRFTTIRSCRIPFTLDEGTAKALIGTEITGSLEQISCTPYQVLCRNTGELVSIDFEYGFRAEGETMVIGKSKVFNIQPYDIIEPYPCW